MKIPFDIKYRPQIESGEYKVETRNGKPVRIICWDRKYGYPICGLVYEKETDREYYINVLENGKKTLDGMMKTSEDLFIITTEPFEQAPETFLMNADASEQTFHENVKKYADKLLELAKKEVLKDLPMWKPAAMAYDGDKLPRIDWMLNRLVARFDEGIFYLDMNDLYKLPVFNE